VKGIAQGLGIHDARRVTSPSFVLLHQYQGKYPLYHLDLFRVENLSDVLGLGWDDLLGSGAVIAVEWAKKIDGFLPEAYLEVEFRVSGQHAREIRCVPHGERFEGVRA
jgi:tRNA threonylcarbamoyladenosine biosynthesis protein TsaE